MIKLQMTFFHWDAFLRSLRDYEGAIESEKRLNVDPYEHAENENSINPIDFEFAGLNEGEAHGEIVYKTPFSCERIKDSFLRRY